MVQNIHSLDKGKYSGHIQEIKEYAGVITSKTTYAENYNTEFHYHENPHLSFILQGGNYEHKKSESSVKNTGDLFFYHSGELHRTIPTDEATKNLNVEIDTHFLTESSISEADIKTAVEKGAGSRLFMLRLHSELQLDDAVTEPAVQALLFSFIREGTTADCQTIHWVRALKEILNDEWNENHSLPGLSQRIGVHPVTISRYFHKYFGCNYGDYVRKLRISRSLALIRAPGYSLTEIAFLCGFADQSHFIRVFRSYTGFRPKTFQQL